MEAAYNDFVTDNLLNTISETSKSVLASCQVLLAAKSNTNIKNIDIVIWINELHKALDDDHEAGLKIKHLGKEIIFYIDHIAHQNQSMIYFKGHTEIGKLVHFVKPAVELNLELQTLKRRSPESIKMPFGLDNWAAFDKAKGLDA